MPEISENSRRIARNTILLYFRMLLLMVIGLFTSRVVINSLGMDDYGIYGAVGGVVMLFTVVTNSVSQSISRYITWHLGRGGRPGAGGREAAVPGGPDQLHSVFSTAVIMQLLFCVLLLVLTETLGLWWMHNRMQIPAGREDAAFWVLQCSMGVLMVSLLSVPFNATIISHERMDVFAWISLGEASLKLGVAVLIFLSPSDKLKLYAVLMLSVAVLVRLAYGIVCRRLFAETRGRIVFDSRLLKEMTSFAGWNVLGSGAYIVNTQGINQMVNVFFGVAVNGARSIALQIENIIKQFISNFLTAINPQITKSWAGADKSYCFQLVGKGVKYSGLILLALGIPLLLETPALLRLWLGHIPENGVIFIRLTLACVLSDLLLNPLLTLIQADGRIKGYYLVSSAVALLCFGASWIAFALGAPAYASYVFFAIAYALVDVVKVIWARKLTGYTLQALWADALRPLIVTSVLAAAVPVLLHFVLPAGLWRLLAVLAAEVLLLPAACWAAALTPGEREFVFRKAGRYLPDPLFLRLRYKMLTGRRLHLWRPRSFNEKIQWLKLHDRRPEYSSLADKAAAKSIVDGRLGKQVSIPTLGCWERASDIDFDSLPQQFVLKCTHDSGSVIVCRDKSALDRDAAVRSLDAALKKNFYYAAREWAYKDIRPAVIAEPLLSDGHAEGLTDYKFFCFNGEPRLLYISRGLEDHSTARISFVGLDWTPAPFRRSDYTPFETLPEKPAGLDKMMRYSRILAEGTYFVRVDFYEAGGEVYFSEMTFYPTGGYLPFGSDEEDLTLGGWLKLPTDK